MSPFGDALFVFINRGRNKLKALYWHRNGFCLWQKRLEQQRFAWPRTGTQQAIHPLSLKELEWLLEGFDLWANKPHETLYYQSTS
jgi:transposase